MPLVLILNKNSSALGIVYYLNQDNPVPNYPNSYAPLHARRPCMQWAGGKGRVTGYTCTSVPAARAAGPGYYTCTSVPAASAAVTGYTCTSVPAASRAVTGYTCTPVPVASAAVTGYTCTSVPSASATVTGYTCTYASVPAASASVMGYTCTSRNLAYDTADAVVNISISRTEDTLHSTVHRTHSLSS